MRTLVWTPTFERAYRRVVRYQPELRSGVERALQKLAEDPFHPGLHSHKLKGELAGAWACTVDYDYRILFDFVTNQETGEKEILLLTMGTHEEVY
jgi:addiction module RelE/StbE family toxin